MASIPAAALWSLAKVHASLEGQGFKLECDAPKSYALLEPELGLAVIDTDASDPTAYGFGILEVSALLLEECWVTKP